MSFADTAVLFVLALLLFGPKKLPGIARQVGKALNEFKRASNEFKAQIEQEVSQLEIQERQVKEQERQKTAEEEQTTVVPTVPPAGSIEAMRPSVRPEPEQSAPEQPAPASSTDAESVSSNASNA